jgi:hypothetical protein
MTAPADRAPLIALISATTAAIAPATAGLSRGFPEADVWNLVDDRLLAEADAHGGLTPELSARMTRLIDHALAEGADGVLLTCSMYGPAAHAYPKADGPVLAADDGAFDAVLHGGFDRVLVAGSLESATRDATRRLSAAADSVSVPLEIDEVVARPATFVATVAAADRTARPDAILLAQYSLAPFADKLTAATGGRPVLTGPDSAAAMLRASIEAARSRP